MPGGQLWGTLFFVFMTFAALCPPSSPCSRTFMSFTMDQWGMVAQAGRALVNGSAVPLLLSMPCASSGFNVLAGCTVMPGSRRHPGHRGLPGVEQHPALGRLAAACCSARRRSGWGWEGFLAEADTGSGLKFPRWARGYVTYVIPVGMLIVFAMGYAPIIAKWAGLG